MDIQLIKIKQNILSDNDSAAEELRKRLTENHVFMINVMSSPGAGKTTTILQAIKYLKDDYRIAVIEGDIDSMVDSEKISEAGVTAIQIQTGGDCHVDAAMLKLAIDDMDLSEFDIIFIENIGNLVCPAEFDTGAHTKMMILSVPEGDDKVLKYPLMFSVCEALVVNKADTISMFDFDLERLKKNLEKLNPEMDVFYVSSKTGEGIAPWVEWLKEKADRVIGV